MVEKWQIRVVLGIEYSFTTPNSATCTIRKIQYLDLNTICFIIYVVCTKHLSFVQDSFILQFFLPLFPPMNWYLIFFLSHFFPVQSYSIIFLNYIFPRFLSSVAMGGLRPMRVCRPWTAAWMPEHGCRGNGPGIRGGG